MHAVVFFVGLIGNALVCLAVYRNHSMRTVTNYFIVNLALADFLVILFCLAPTVIWDVTETWFMGEKLCKIILYIQVSEGKNELIRFRLEINFQKQWKKILQFTQKQSKSSQKRYHLTTFKNFI